LSLPLIPSDPSIPTGCSDRSDFKPKFGGVSFSLNIVPELKSTWSCRGA
jgi:hypothetical protein